jgi:predicted enzyme related to lactoylglutathione lyase
LAAFYKELFGWEMQATPGFSGYNLVAVDQSGVGGAIGQGSDEMPSYQAIYVEVARVDEHLAKAEANGASTLVPRTELPGMVTYGLFRDPAGNLVGVVEEEIPSAG